MPSRGITFERSTNPAPEEGRFFDIEEQLATVVEQDGITMLTARGMSMRVPKKRTAARRIQEMQPMVVTEDGAPRISLVDSVAELTAVNVEVVVRAKEPGGLKPIAIRRREHVRSEYVLSLRDISLRTFDVEEPVFAETLFSPPPAVFLPQPSIFGTVARDLNIDGTPPHVFTDQFTPDDFFANYTGVYSPLERLMSRVEREWRSIRPTFFSASHLRVQEEAGVAVDVVALEDISIEVMPRPEDMERAASVSPPVGEVALDSEPEAGRSSCLVAIEEVVEKMVVQEDAPQVTPEIFVQTEYPEAIQDDQAPAEAVLGEQVGARVSWRHTLVGFVALLVVVLLPAAAVSLLRSVGETQAAVERSGKQALAEVRSAVSGGSLQASAQSLRNASSHFRDADAALEQSKTLSLALASVMPRRFGAARALLEAGDKTTEAGRLLAGALEKSLRDPDRRLDERFEVAAAYARGVLPLVDDAVHAVASVSPSDIPADQRETFEKLATQLAVGSQAIRDFADVSDFLSVLVGKDRPRTYLFVFQNQTELRPTGGFMGSVAEVVVDRGRIVKTRVMPGGTYDLKGQLLAHVISPEPLHLINPHWQFQDANWFPDFPTSAKKIRWFWSKAGQPTLDGVVAVNASFMERILAVTGPIEMPQYGKTINASNFLLETQKAVEIEYDKEANTPKKFIGDLMQALMEKVKTLPQDKWLAMVGEASTALETKEIQVALTKDEEEIRAEQYGWSGTLKETGGDSLAIIEANVAGQKTDGVIDEKVEHRAEIGADGGIVDHVTLTRTHRGVKGDLFRGVRNVSYVRLYVPQGSVLMEARGFDAPSQTLFKKPDEDYVMDDDLETAVTDTRAVMPGVTSSEEAGRTVFGGWVQLDPGRTQTVSYRYRLPFTVFDLHRRMRLASAPQESEKDDGGSSEAHAAYSLLLTSQSGKANRELQSTVNIDPALSILWSRGGTSQSASVVSYQGVWDRDRVLATLLATRSSVVVNR